LREIPLPEKNQRQKLSSGSCKKILEALGFEMLKEGIDEMLVKVPYNKTDISLPADIVEEILRIDGYDNIEIPSAITITPPFRMTQSQHSRKGGIIPNRCGFNEILTNSITNSQFFSPEVLQTTVKMVNSLSAERISCAIDAR
jgi:phenylalanyl-tRNA synthetase beta chain